MQATDWHAHECRFRFLNWGVEGRKKEKKEEEEAFFVFFSKFVGLRLRLTFLLLLLSPLSPSSVPKKMQLI